MARQVEIPVKVTGAGTRELGGVRDALKGAKTEVGALNTALGQYDRASETAARASRQARDEFGRFTAAAKQVQASLSGVTSEARASSSEVQSMLAGWAKLTAGAYALKEIGLESAKYAARTETLAIVTNQMAKANNLNAQAVQGVVKAVREQGITTQESYQTVTKMIQAQLDLSKATTIARMAQDAAVIANINSSEALAGIIHGITTRQTDVLRTYGIIVDFESAYAKAAKGLGRELLATEKQQVALNAVLAEASKISGAYEAAMGSVGKQLTSLKRYVDEARDAIGKEFVGALGSAVTGLTEGAKHLKEHADFYAGLAKAIALATGALVTFVGTAKLISGLEALKGLLAGGGAAAGAGLLGKLGLAGASGTAVGAGLAAVPLGAGAFFAYQQQQDFIKQLEGSLEGAGADTDKFRQKMDGLLARLKSGSADAKEFGDAVREAFAPGRGRKLLDNDSNWSQANFKNLDFKEFVRNTLKLDPSMVQSVVEGGGAKGRALQDLLGAEFGKQTKFNLDYLPGFKLKKPHVETEDEKKKREKQAEQTREAVKAIIDQIAMGALDVSPYTGKPYEADVARARGTQALRDALPGARRAQSLLNNDNMAGARERDQMAMLDASGKYKSELQQHEDFWKKAADTLRESQLEPMAQAIEKIGDWNDRVISFAQSMGAMGFDQRRSMVSIESSAAQRRGALEAETNGDPKAITAAYQERLSLSRSIYAIDMEAAAAMADALKRREMETRALMDHKRADREAELDHELQLLELAKRRTQEYREGAGRVYDAMRSGGRTGLRQLAMGQLDNVGRTMFQNVAEKVQGMGSGPGLPNFASNSTIGWLFKGTMFENKSSNPLISSQDKLRKAVEDNTAVQRGQLAGRGLLAADPGYASLFGSGGLFGSGTSSTNPMIFSALGGGGFGKAASAAAGTKNLQLLSSMTGIPVNSSAGKSIGSGVMTGAAVAAAGFGVYQGIKQGGAQGWGSAVSSGLMGAAAFGGPAAPFLAAGAVAAGVISSFLGPDRAGRQQEIASALEGSHFTDKGPITREIDFAGNDVDFDWRGNSRVANNTTINLSIKAFDSKSVLEAGPEIAESVRQQVLRKHPLTEEFRQMAGGGY